MGLVDSWLEGIGLAYAVPVFSAQGINSPDLLSELDVVDFPELGIMDQNDRKKLFYLIQRVRLALDRGRAADSKSAPQADSTVSSTTTTTAATEQGHGRQTTAAASARLEETRETTPAEENAASSGTVRFRSEPEVPAKRGVTAASRLVEGDRRAAPDSGAAGGGGGGSGAPRQTPLKVQRPTSYRRPKTPHAEGTQRQPVASNVSAAPVGGGDGGKRDGARQAAAAENPRQPATAAKANGNAGASAVAEDPTAVGRYRQDQLAGGGGLTARAAAPEKQRPPPQQKHGNLADDRSVLEPMQLDEVEGRAHDTSSRSRIPPPLSAQACEFEVPAARGFDERRSVRDRTGNRSPELASPETIPHSRRSYSKRFSPDEDDGGVQARSGEFSSAATTAEDKKVARLHRAKRDAGTAATTQAAATRGYGASHQNRVESPRAGLGSPRVGLGSPRVGLGSPRVGLGSPRVGLGSLRARVGSPRVGTGTRAWQESRAEEAEAAAAAKAEMQRETAAELAVHLISAHREDVRSALAAARRDMDLVSMADQDRHPSALLAYAREVEGVLGARLAAGAKLRAALDSYVALRQASSSPRKPETGAGVGGVRTRGRAVQT